MIHEKQMQHFFARLNNADGEIALEVILVEMNDYIDNIQEDKEKSLAEQSFKYYFTKRLSHLEDNIKHLKENKQEYV